MMLKRILFSLFTIGILATIVFVHADSGDSFSYGSYSYGGVDLPYREADINSELQGKYALCQVCY